MNNYFTLLELFPHCSNDEVLRGVNDYTVSFHLAESLQVLNNLRFNFGKALYINSGYRDKKHNQRVGGVSSSEHMSGIAFDITFLQFDKQLDHFLDCIRLIDHHQRATFGQVIVYKDRKFVHVALSSTKHPSLTISYI